MNIVLRHPDALFAQAARDHLLAHGILAAVVDHRDGWSATTVSYDVMLCFGKQREEASTLLEMPGWRPGEGADDGDADHDEPGPDLSRLDASLAPPCPACDTTLPLDATIESCPACAEQVDVAELIMWSHGPEALEHCYAQDGAPLDLEILDKLALLCLKCGYSLEGMPSAGVCPECGDQYDKARIVRDFLHK